MSLLVRIETVGVQPGTFFGGLGALVDNRERSLAVSGLSDIISSGEESGWGEDNGKRASRAIR